MKDKQLLIDSYVFVPSLVEDKRKEGGRVVARGEFARAGIATENKRVYSHALWERELKRLGKQISERKVYGELDHPCFADKFEVLTVSGWKHFDEVKVGDEVWARQGGKAVISRIEAVTDVPYSGVVYRLKGKNIDSAFTPNHKMMFEYRPNEGNTEEEYATLKDIVSNRSDYGHCAIPKKALWTQESVSYFVIPGVPYATGRTKNDVSKDLALDAGLAMAFIGLYLSEGSVASGGNNYTVSIHQKSEWTRKHIYDNVLSKFPAELSWRQTDNGFELCDQRIHQYVSKLGDCYSKYVPEEIKRLDPDLLGELLYWFTIGDGRFVSGAKAKRPYVVGESFKESFHSEIRGQLAVANTRRDVFTASKRLIDDLHECLVKAGGAGSITTILPGEDYTFAGRPVEAKNKAPLYQLHFSNTDRIWLDPRLNIIEEQHSGNVYCFTTTHGNFMCRQNGKAFWTGNSDGRTMLKRASHIITGLQLENGVVVGEAEILDTQEGRNLKAILDAGGAVGVSSRGFGTTRPNNEGIDVVQDDYRLLSFDFVADPANVTSYPSIHIEDKKPAKTERIMEDKLTLESLRQSNPKLYENLRDEAEREFEKRGAQIWAKKIEAARTEASTDLKSVFAENLKAAVEAAKAEVEAAVRAELLADPNVAGAKAALEHVRAALRPYIVPEDVADVVAAKDKEIEALNAKIADVELKNANLANENSELAAVAKEAGYKYHLETMLRDVPHSELIRKTIGDVKAFENVEALNAKVSEIVDEIKKVQAKTEERDREIEQLKEQSEKYRLAAEKALEATKLMSVQTYIEERLRFHPKSQEIRPLIEAVQPESKEAVDNVLSKFREKKRDAAALAEARARVKAWVGSEAVEYIRESEEHPRNKGTNQSDFNGLGASADELRALSGMGSDEN